MFREMRRNKQQIPLQECIDILTEEPRGVLCMLGDDDYPYGIPVSHYYCPEDGHIYIHGAKVGHKVDAISAHEKVSFCVYDKGYRREGEWALNIRSVVVFGKASFVEDIDKAEKICRAICHKFTDDEEHIEKEVQAALNRVLCIEIIPDHITGKLVNES